jgi:hypothetical protein
MESPKAIPQGEGLREQTESTTSNYFCLCRVARIRHASVSLSGRAQEAAQHLTVYRNAFT